MLKIHKIVMFGVWVDKDVPLSEFENTYELLQNTPCQIIVNNYDGINQIINNPRIAQINLCLDKFAPDSTVMLNNYEII